jgi:hypothetical protein
VLARTVLARSLRSPGKADSFPPAEPGLLIYMLGVFLRQPC